MFSKIEKAPIDGSIVMAIGIIMNGIGQKAPLLKTNIGPLLSVFLILLLIMIYFKYAVEIIHGTFYEQRLGHPIHSFSIGTIAAATSVTVAAIVYDVPNLRGLAVILFGINIFLFFLYYGLIIRNYYLIRKQNDLIRLANGSLLLACVCSQAIVKSGNTLFGSAFPRIASLCLILLGISAYALGITVIMKRYIGKNKMNLADGWTNANCIIHGDLEKCLKREYMQM